MKVLLVDDSSTMRRIQRNVLAKLGYTDIVEAEDGLSAQVKLERIQVDLILLDWNMPNIDGLTFLKALRGEGVSTPVIMVTTEGQKDNVIAALQSGANSYVVKPFTPDILEKRINAVMEKVHS